MLAEIIIYIALFAALFSGAFATVFQTVDEIKYLQEKKSEVDELYFLSSKLDYLAQSSNDWHALSSDAVIKATSGSGVPVDFVSSQLFETSTSSNRILLLTLNINHDPYTFSYVQEK
jgi:hypothetical protein